MQYSYNRLLVLVLCALILADGIEGVRLRVPGLRISSSFNKGGDCPRKKAPVAKYTVGPQSSALPFDGGKGGDL